MLIYSKKIVQFIQEIQAAVRAILAREVGCSVTANRFYHRGKSSSYPINVVIYSNKRVLGYFDPEFYELGFNESLMETGREALHDIIRHELAHYIVYIEQGGNLLPHGKEFKAFCTKMGWKEEISKASFCLEETAPLTSAKEDTILRKVEKLLALATSSNKNEREQALIKSQELLLKHNLEASLSTKEERVFLKRLFKQKKVDAKMQSIAKILATFFVAIVFHRGEAHTCLEIIGDSVNVEIAEYVATVLDKEFDTLWKEARKKSSLKGAAAKNAFFLGVAKGYVNKMQMIQEAYRKEVTNSLVLINKKLIEAKALVYPRLSTAKSRSQGQANARALGEKIGKALTINPALRKAPSTEKIHLLT